jgi:hypothetical protein
MNIVTQNSTGRRRFIAVIVSLLLLGFVPSVYANTVFTADTNTVCVVSEYQDEINELLAQRELLEEGTFEYQNLLYDLECLYNLAVEQVLAPYIEALNELNEEYGSNAHIGTFEDLQEAEAQGIEVNYSPAMDSSVEEFKENIREFIVENQRLSNAANSRMAELQSQGAVTESGFSSAPTDGAARAVAATSSGERTKTLSDCIAHCDASATNSQGYWTFTGINDAYASVYGMNNQFWSSSYSASRIDSARTYSITYTGTSMRKEGINNIFTYGDTRHCEFYASSWS